MCYQVYDAGINTGTTYLTETVAFFLGGIYAANENVLSGNTSYWIAPFRYNFGYSTDQEITDHFDYISNMSATVHGYTVMRDNIRGTRLDSGRNRLPGFSTFFEATTLTSLENEIPNLMEVLRASDRRVQKAFIIGVIDGRGSPDVNVDKGLIRYISLDCPNDDIGRFLSAVMTNYGIDINYNIARDRLEGGKPRNHQLRIKNAIDYMANNGYISPARFRKMRDAYLTRYGVANTICDNGFLMGLKYLRGE